MIRPARISITLMSGPRDGEVVQFDLPTEVYEKEINFGRRENCDISLSYDSQVSRLHARLIFDGDSFWLEDLGSRNGTFVGEEQVEEKVEILPGTLFRLGRTWMQLDPLPPDETQAAEAVSDDESL